LRPARKAARVPEEVVEWRARILEEARALCRVEHPNVVRFYSLQRDDEHDVIGLAMEYVPGKSLRMLIQTSCKPTLKSSLDYFARAPPSRGWQRSSAARWSRSCRGCGALCSSACSAPGRYGGWRSGSWQRSRRMRGSDGWRCRGSSG